MLSSCTPSLEDSERSIRNWRSTCRLPASANALWHQYRSELERVTEVGVLPDPEVNVAYTFNPMMYESIPGRFSLSAMQMFPWFGTLGARRDMQRASAEADYHALNSRRLELFGEIRTVWTNLSGVQIQIRIAQETLELVRDLVTLVETRYETARAGQADLLRIQMEEERLKTLISNLEEKAFATRARFNGFLGRDPDTEVETADRLETMELPWTRDEVVLRMHERNPRFGELNAREQIAREQRRLARLDGRPGFGIGLEVMGSDFGTMSMLPHSGEMVVGMASIRIPLYRSRYRSQDRQAVEQLKAVDYQRQEAEYRLISQLEEAFGEWRSAARSVELITEELTPRAEQALEILSSEYASGNTRLDEVLQIQRQLLDLELERLGELVRLHEAMIRLEALSGDGGLYRRR